MHLAKVKIKPVILAIFIFSGAMFLMPQSVHSQTSPLKVTNLWLNDKKPLKPGSLIASCIVEEDGDIPHKRYALIYIDYDHAADNLNLVLEKTAVRWGGWEWEEVPWFSPVSEKKSCRAGRGGSECLIAMAGEVNIKLKLVDSLGGISAQKETAK